jgi:mRNA-degrading endonuclease RelE of RelBE toxin-antitoxin system
MSQYSVYVIPDEFQAIKKLPGNVRQRIKRAIDDLADNPRPPASKQLEMGDAEDVDIEVRRIRLDNWRASCISSLNRRRSSTSSQFGSGRPTTTVIWPNCSPDDPKLSLGTSALMWMEGFFSRSQLTSNRSWSSLRVDERRGHPDERDERRGHPASSQQS